MASNKYRVTFISPSESEQRTVMTANSLPDLIRKVENIIADPNGYFENDKKNNCYFKVMKENVTFIQYELLFSHKEIHMEKLKHIAPAIWQKLFQKVKDPELYALSLLDSDVETKEYIIAQMDLEFRIRVEKEIAKRWETAPSEIVEAQEILLEELSSFIQE
ncbi:MULTISPECIES: LysR family transcriptional regulator [Bacillus cereus group]|uniref:LysR family transcriptional regulator n=1 Tax=Bacillus cereus group TaxID=86661 RepID=UPI00086461A3|nr:MULTISPECIES: LysR family transcriptional regulator [Bacillus cereus group]AWC28308.1 LysR family transcriptional regulator [Bacillus cytotoxicus]AWC40307.1 LysR family transcriptional regulator [Bacillus cytotoxicus]AWC48238.1 LysR family transcriptional regulator [Bacillus cytotoxicus]AWC52375.1 LysR family transcriptional regulator [Bacillus cytotoxicus]AWC56509.1 LysR family transcriptional regulator [Bacillus cytotoxicus]